MEENVLVIYYCFLEPCNHMFKVISDIMAHSLEMWNIIITAINFCIATKVNCAIMIIISNNYGIKYLSNLLHVGPCNDMFKEISDTMAHCVRCEMHSEFQRLKENELCIDVYQSNHDGRKCLTNLLQLDHV